MTFSKIFTSLICRHHHHVQEKLGVFPVPWSSRCSWSLHLFLGRPTFLRPFGSYCSACFGSLFVSILCTCCSHFFWYCFISFTMFCAPVFPLIHWFFNSETKTHKLVWVMLVAVFWIITPCSLVGNYRRFGRTCRLLQDTWMLHYVIMQSPLWKIRFHTVVNYL